MSFSPEIKLTRLREAAEHEASWVKDACVQMRKVLKALEEETLSRIAGIESFIADIEYKADEIRRIAEDD